MHSSSTTVSSALPDNALRATRTARLVRSFASRRTLLTTLLCCSAAGMIWRRANEAIAVHRGADYRDPEGAGGRDTRCGALPQAQHERCNVYTWKSKYGGIEVSEAKRLRALEAENAKLKRLLADAMLDNAALKDLFEKKW